MANAQTYQIAGMFTTGLRWVTGWTYFSAFWRRLVLENKLNPDEAGYIGEKFNHFLPNALGIKPLIENLVSNPESLWWAMLLFTMVEGVVGLLFMVGLFTRLMSIAVFCLALGILLGAGWLGTTCLDEWQIGVLGVAAGFTVFISGGGKFSADARLLQKNNFMRKRGVWIGSGVLPVTEKRLSRIVLTGAVIIITLTLFTNQYFHGGVYGRLHNPSVRPHVTITNARMVNDSLLFTVFRDEGADVYGSFLIGIKLRDAQGAIVFEQTQEQLAALKQGQISNYYVAKVKTGKHSLVLPLGAKAGLYFTDEIFKQLKGQYTLELVDISGLSWQQKMMK